MCDHRSRLQTAPMRKPAVVSNAFAAVDDLYVRSVSGRADAQTRQFQTRSDGGTTTPTHLDASGLSVLLTYDCLSVSSDGHAVCGGAAFRLLKGR
jgi:hypothetical protein